jgi:hypothetical protein
MNKYNSMVAPEQLEKGDIIQFPTQGTARERMFKPLSYGYVHEIEYDARHNDEVVSVSVLPIEKRDDAKKQDLPHRVLNQEGLGRDSGLAPNTGWAVMLAPVRLYTKMDHLGEHGIVQRRGNIAHSDEEKRLREHLDNIGDERLHHNRFGGPRMAKPREDLFGVYMRGGAGSNRKWDESEYELPQPKTKRLKKAKPGMEGKVIDLDLDKAIEILGLDKSVADLFQNPFDRFVKKFTTLREVNDLLNKDPDAAAKYMPKASVLERNVSLSRLQEEIHIGIINGLSEPRKGAGVKPITDLRGAFELVTQRPEEMGQYMFMGPKLQEYAKAQIPAAFLSRASCTPSGEALAQAGTAIKDAWRGLTNAYGDYMNTRTVPEAFREPNGAPAWKMVPKAL